jgi:Aspartyl protease
MGTEIAEAKAKSLGLEITPVGNSRVFLSDIKLTNSVTLKSFGLGHIAVNDWPVWIMPVTILNKGTTGLIGADTLMGFDVEFDPAHSKLNLFSPNICTKDAAYWTRGAAVAIPIEIDSSTHVTFNATLDGRPITVMLDTGAYNSIMNIDVAEDLFGFGSRDPRLKQSSADNVNGADAAIYEFPFKSLSLEGLTISNPDIQLLPRDLFPYGFRDQPRVILGMNVLRHLRMYIAYKQHVLYLTDANAQ